jgi:ubiquinone biosynthesis protein COQ9
MSETIEAGAQASDWAAATEQRLLDMALRVAPRRGWSGLMVQDAGRAIGLSRADLELLVPGGPRDLAALLSRRHDAAALAALAHVDPQSLKIRQRIRSGVLARLAAAAADDVAVRRWAGFLALPPSLPLALRLVWESADALWRWAGDTATDENHYSKRAILSEILVSSLAVQLSAGANAAAVHVDGRIETVMAFEKWKAGLKPAQAAASIAAALGRMRYGA